MRLFIVALSICGVTARKQTLTVNVNGKDVAVSYPIGLSQDGMRGIAREIVEKLNLISGFGCQSQLCVEDELAKHLTEREPQSLDGWLAGGSLALI